MMNLSKSTNYNKYSASKTKTVNNPKNNISISSITNASSLPKSGVHHTLPTVSKLVNNQKKNTSNFQLNKSVMHNPKCKPPNYENEVDKFYDKHSLESTKFKKFNDSNRCLDINTEELKIDQAVDGNLNIDKADDKDDGWITVKSSNLKKRNVQNIPNALPNSNNYSNNIKNTGSLNNRTIFNETKYKLSLNKTNLQVQGSEIKNQKVVPSMKNKLLHIKNDNNSNSVFKNNNIPKSKDPGSRIIPSNNNCRADKNNFQNKNSGTFKPLLNEAKSEILSEEDQQKVQARLLKKLKIKEDKKRKREDKARLLRDNLRRDTKINFISQETIEKYSNAGTSSYYNTTQGMSKKQTSYNFNAVLEEYPTMNLGRQSQGFRQLKNIDDNSYLYKKEHSIEKSESVSTETSSQPCRSGLVRTNKPYFEFYKHNNETLQNEDEEKSFVEKKKVKTKDRMNLAIISLLEMKQNEKKKGTKVKSNLESNPVKPIIEMRGKVRENSEKKLSTLKKNILREKKRQEELLYALLKGKEENTITAQTNKIELNKIPDQSMKDFVEPPEIKENLTDLKVSKSDISSPTNKLVELALEEEVYSDSCLGDDSTSEIKIANSLIVEDNNNLECLPSKSHQNKIENSDIIIEINKLLNPVHSKKFREYCDQIVTPEINSILTDIIQLLVKFQDRLYQQDPLKAKVRRRFYCGLKESKKHMNKVVCIVMAPNLKPSPGPGCVDELVMKVLNGAAESGIPIVFGLSNRQIGRLCHKKVPVSCFSIVNYHGVKDQFDSLMDLLPEAKKQYQDLVASRGLNIATSNENEPLEEEHSSSEDSITASLLQSLRDEEKITINSRP